MPRWETCTRCGKKYNPNRLTVDERLIQAIFGEHLCPKCHSHANASICVKCTKEVLSPVYFNDDPYHSKCLAEMLES